MKIKRLLALLLAVVMIVSLAACNKNEEETEQTYTYRSYTTSLGDNWNPHTWEDSGDSAILGYLETALVDVTVLDSENAIYQWIYTGAVSIEDVTADHQDDLTKYAVNLPDGVEDASEVTSQYVYEIKLREGMKWEDGTIINADTYIYSMQQLLDPVLQNYRANNYYSGDGTLAGAYNYFFAGKTFWQDNCKSDYSYYYNLSDLVKGDDGVYTTPDGAPVYFTVTEVLTWLGGYCLNDYAVWPDYYDFNYEHWDELCALVDEEGHIAVTDQSIEWLASFISTEGWNETRENVVSYMYFEQTLPEADWETVGFYKVDDYTVRYVCENAYDYYYFLGTMSSGILVHEELYESCKQYDADGNYTGNSYGTSMETTMSYGPYKIESLEKGKQIVYVRNENYFEFQVDEDGNLYSTSETIGFKVDGEYVEQYTTERVIIDVMDDDTAKLAFLKGELDDWGLSAEDALTYSTSEQLYKANETYTMRLFFNTTLDKLQTLDAKGNQNSVVLTNYNFRKAMSLAIDREDLLTATAGYTASYSILNSLYHYNFYEDPTSRWRDTDQAKQAICNVYDVKWGEGEIYATLDEAYASINGYNVTEAKNLFTQACQELVDAGLYTEGQDIVIEVAWKKGSLDASDNSMVALLNQYLNTALEGTGFGNITLKAIDNLEDRYSAVISGEYAMGYGGWGGAALYLFQCLRVYCDNDYVSTGIHERGCWNPSEETLTLNVNGEDVTMTWQDWSKSLTGTGIYANADTELKLDIFGQLEEGLLKMYNFIPLHNTTTVFMLSYKVSMYTENYNLMYGWGGLRLYHYNYSDQEWADYCASVDYNIGY